MPEVKSNEVASRKTGRRSVTTAELQATAGLSGTLEGLERGRVLNAFKEAAAAMGFAGWVQTHIDILFRYSWNEDWQAGWPRFVWPSNGELCRLFGITLSGLQKRTRRLIDLGLIRATDIGTGNRWGQRCPITNKILQSSGFDLSPLGERVAEFRAASAEQDTRLKQARDLRARCSAWSRRVLSMTDHGVEKHLDGGDWLAWATEAKKLAESAKNLFDPSRLTPIEARLKALHCLVAEALHATVLPVECVDKEPQGSSKGTPITTTNKLEIAKATAPAGGGLARQVGGVTTGGDNTSGSRGWSEGTEESALFRGFPVTPQVLLHLVPTYRDWVHTSTPSWDEISDACDLVRKHMGISTHLYAQTRLVLGEKGTSVAIGTIAVKHQAKLVRNPGGYLRRMLEKQHAGELRLDRTLHGLADAAGQPGKAKRRGEVASGIFGRLLS